MSASSSHFLRLPGLRISNAYLFGLPGRPRWLVDTGHRLERRRLLAGLRAAGVEPSALRGVMLTHRHSDHAGNARFLQRNFGVRVAAHRLDAAILSGKVERPRLERGGGDLIAGAFVRLENRWPAERVELDIELEDGDELGGLRVHHVGGHTPGSVFFVHKDSRALLSGDMMLTAHPPLLLQEGFALPYESFTADMSQALASIAAFHDAGVDYAHLLPGHGEMWLGGARERVLIELARLEKEMG